ncbi:MAG TPA: hypothetical protein VNQ73_15650 [Ilumatobacter sp.]|nr:hypothetical protein [Ilumatobacter sp.]
MGVGLAVVGPGAVAHVAAGGALPVAPVVVALAAVGSLAAMVGRSVRWTFPRLVAAALAAQPLLHLAFGAGHAGHAGHSSHAVHAATTSTHADGRMVAAHLVVSLVVAVGLRWGVRWLCALPAIGRALVLPARGVSEPQVVRVRFAPIAPVPRRNLAVLAARGSRGPPR